MVPLIVPCLAQEKQACEVSVAALTLPEDSGGLLHWRGADTATSPLQLSTRYFSDHMKVASNVIQFYKDPLAGIARSPRTLLHRQQQRLNLTALTDGSGGPAAR